MKRICLHSMLALTLFTTSITSTTPPQNLQSLTKNRLKEALITLGCYAIPISYVLVSPLLRTWHCNETSQQWNDACDTFMDITTTLGLLIPVGRLAYAIANDPNTAQNSPSSTVSALENKANTAQSNQE